MLSGLFVILPQASTSGQWGSIAQVPCGPWSECLVLLLHSSTSCTRRSPSASLHYICLSMPKSTHKVSLWWLLVSFNLSWAVETSSDCYRISFTVCKSASMSSWMCSKCSNWTLYTVLWPLAGLSDHHWTHSTKCLIAILRDIFKSCVGTRYQCAITCLGLTKLIV